MHFGATLRLLRIDSGLSLRALAQRIGVSSAYLSRVEHGYDAVPTPDRLSAIARELGLPAPLLLELGHQVEPFVSRYLEAVPAANAMFLEIARRNLNALELARIKAFIDAEFPLGAPSSGGAAPARLGELLSPERVILHLSCGDLEDVVDLAAARLAPGGGGPKRSVLAREILERERESPTALGAGVVVPHAQIEGVLPSAVLVTLAKPLRSATPDDTPLRLVVVLVGNERGRRSLERLAQVARLATDDVVGRLCSARDPGELLSRLAQIEAVCC